MTELTIKKVYMYIVMTEVVWACHAQMAWKQTSYIFSVVAQTVYPQSSYNIELFSPISNMGPLASQGSKGKILKFCYWGRFLLYFHEQKKLDFL
jgi:hypothetical protein